MSWAPKPVGNEIASTQHASCAIISGIPAFAALSGHSLIFASQSQNSLASDAKIFETFVRFLRQ